MAATKVSPAACCSPLTAPALSKKDATVTARVFKALADPHRVRIVNLLATDPEPVCVCDITSHIGLAQATTSFHLKKLVDAGLVEREQRGTWAYYSIKSDVLSHLRTVFETKEALR
jgi:ArsR family transcriptional regulator, arsenate/arsenite/antimonite-responsive transcriptional repressor